MKRYLLVLVALMSVSSVLTAQSVRSLSEFDKVSAQQGIDVFLSKGDELKARVETDNIDLSDVITEVNGRTLKIYLDGNNYRNVDVKVYVTFDELTSLKASSAASIRVEDFVTTDGDFEIGCSSAGDIDLELKAKFVEIDISSSGDVDLEVTAEEMDVDISSAGDLEVSGVVGKIEIDASSSGDVDGYYLESEYADLGASSGASIKISVSKSLKARASSGGSIRYKGSPEKTNNDSSSGGSVRKS